MAGIRFLCPIRTVRLIILSMTASGRADTLPAMSHARSARRAFLLVLSLLSACAAADAPYGGAPSANRSKYGDRPTGAFGHYLVGRFALTEADPDTAATELLRAAALAPNEPDVVLQAFIASLAAERPEAVTLARQMPDNQVAQLLLADEDLRAGRWAEAERRYHALPRQGLTQLLQPLLVAWAQQGAGQTDAALLTLRPFVEAPRFRDIFALHAGMIADLANRPADAARYFRMVETGTPDPDLRLAQILASWQERNNRPADARRMLAAVAQRAPEIGISLRNLLANARTRPVASVTDGVAEAYVALAAALRGQDQNDFALLMLHLAFRMRPDFAAARLLEAEMHVTRKHLNLALKALESVPARDPIGAMAQLRRAAMLERLERPDEALRELKRISAEHPESRLPDIQIGDILRIQKRYDEAIAAYSRAIARIDTPVKSDWIVFYDRGVAYERANRWPLAEADLKLALQLSPDQPFVMNYLGYSWADMGRNLDKARDMIQRAAVARKDDGAVTDSLGWVMFRQGDVANAVRTLERAVELEPEDATITGHLGDAYFAAGRKVEARYQWKRALTLNPAAEDVPKLEGKLKSASDASVANGQRVQ